MSPSQTAVPSSRTTRASAQSDWSQDIPSPPSPTVSTNSVASPRSTDTGTPGIPSRMSSECQISAPPASTPNTTLPRPPLVCSFESTPTTASNRFPGWARYTTTRLTA